MLRAPRSFSSQATLPPPGAATKSDGNGVESTCSRVKVFAPAAETRRIVASRKRLMCVSLLFVFIRVYSWPSFQLLPYRQPVGEKVRQPRTPDLRLHTRNIVLFAMILHTTALGIE